MLTVSDRGVATILLIFNYQIKHTHTQANNYKYKKNYKQLILYIFNYVYIYVTIINDKDCIIYICLFIHHKTFVCQVAQWLDSHTFKCGESGFQTSAPTTDVPGSYQLIYTYRHTTQNFIKAETIKRCYFFWSTEQVHLN